MKQRDLPFLLAAVALGFAAQAPGATIFSDGFTSGTTGALAGEAPQVRPGTETWSAASVFSKNTTGDGIVNSSGSGAAHLAIPTFDLGSVYTVTASVSNTTTGSNWVGLGFTTQTSGSNAAWNSAGTGRFWMLWRGNDELRTFTQGAGGTSYSGGASPSGVDNVLDMRVVIDVPEALVSYFYKNPNATEWTSLFSQSLANEGNINGVGFTTLTSGTSISSFEYAVIPEPSTTLLGGFAMLALMLRRRR